ncbi:uncharacterized protein LOC125150262 isoform X3 [Prionailurus viverrinus]|uniref:uncharacterized protein LOC125150262 isoform X3 n=1 Tax=Prionailurus viverrinus TaxID=61388 RepID=UPI001FF2138D|nr:uncharacterized protein LOC125150262 isoform X3 [Prionailurus viverrinus]
MPGKSVPGKGSLAPEVLLDQPFSAAGTGWEVTLCQRRPQQCHLPPGPRGPQDALPRPSSGEPPGSSTLAPGLVQAMPRREVAVPGGIGAEAVAFSALALCLLLCDECEHPRSRDCLMHYVLHKYLLNEWDYRGCHGRGRSAAGAGGGGEDNDAWKTQRSGRSWMARPGPGDPRPAPQAGSRRAGLRSSAWARQRAPGGGGAGGAGTGEPG